jgi:methyl-accepting chemotaxis protein
MARRLLPERIPRAAGWNLGIVGVFALTAVVLLTLTALHAHTVSTDVQESVNPQLAGVNEHLSALPILDSSDALTAQVAAAAGPVGADLAETRAANAEIAATMGGVAADSDSTRASVDRITTSVAAITADLGDLRPLIRAVDASLGDLVSRLDQTARSTDGIAEGFDGTSATVARLADLTGRVGSDVDDVPARMVRIRRHTENIAAAEVLARIDDLGHRLRLPHRSGLTTSTTKPGPGLTSW